jgi:para-aminobenzoate synthetase component 1
MSNIAFLPVAYELPYQNPAVVMQLFSGEKYFCFLDSAQINQDCGRYSFICFDPFLIFKSKGRNVCLNDEIIVGDPLALLQQQLDFYATNTIEGLPPFQGGAAGYFSYELLKQIELVAAPEKESDYDINLGFYDVVIAFDHIAKTMVIVSQGLPELDYIKRISRAKLRMQQVLAKINQSVSSRDLVVGNLAHGIVSNFTRASYETMVAKAIDYIHAGDIFQANMTQQFSAVRNHNVDSLDIYLRLRKNNPASFAAYINFMDVEILSSSPERFLLVQDRVIETRPIKGTRSRSGDPKLDAKLRRELANSEKDIAENTMIVDLMRNDLSRVCTDDSVEVVELCAVKSFATVHHLVSTIKGKLQDNKKLCDLLRATFPGGSITGAPKIRAMEIIAELEKTPRGQYCGSIAYLGFDGSMDSAIVIRTMIIHDDVISFNAGGAVVADSDPAAEYKESLVKAKALMLVLNEEEARGFID